MIGNIDLVKEIINCIPTNFTQLEKARFIYIKLGEILEFNHTFHNTIFTHRFLIKHKNYDLNRLDNNQIMCHNWADIYIKLLTMIGIKAYKQSAYHAWVMIEIDDMLIYADATIDSYNDLTRIKYHDKLVHFYPVLRDRDEKGLPIRACVEGFDEVINIVDQKINYQNSENINIQSLKQKVQAFASLEQKVDALLHYAVKEDVGFCEQFSYFMHTLSYCLNSDERSKIHTTEMIKVNDIGNFEFMYCISLKLEECYKYYMLKANESFAVSKEQILHYVDSGYGVHNQYDILGLFYPLKFAVPKNILNRLGQQHFMMHNPFINNKHNIR